MIDEDLDLLNERLKSMAWQIDCNDYPLLSDCETEECVLDAAVKAIDTLREDKAALEVLLRDRPDVEWFPLRKPHGRLGDLSKLEAIMREGYEDLCQHPVAKEEDINKAVQLGFCMASGRIFLAETVVPAEEEST